jgi:hypothetical protein
MERREGGRAVTSIRSVDQRTRFGACAVTSMRPIDQHDNTNRRSHEERTE